MSKRSVLIPLALTLVTLLLPFAAQAGDVFHFSGELADADFSSTDPSGCIGTFVFTFASDDRFQAPPGPGTSSSEISIAISPFDFCTSTLLMDAFGSTALADPDLQVAGNLSSATLDTTVNVCDLVSSSCFDVFIDLTWTATSAPTISNFHSHFQAPGFVFNTHFNGTFRSAQASGSVSDGTTNFTPNPSDRGGIGSSQSGTVEVS